MPEKSRRRLAVLIPSTNTTVEREFNAWLPDNISVHAGRMLVTDPAIHDNASTRHLLKDVLADLDRSVRTVITCIPQVVVMGMSAPTFYGGFEGAENLKRRIASSAGVPVVGGSLSVHGLLRTMKSSRIGVLTPYQSENDREVSRFFEDCGYRVVKVIGLRSKTATGIADTPFDESLDALKALCHSGADTLVQVGTNLPLMEHAVALESDLGLPIVPINAACLWDALRTLNCSEAETVLGPLTRERVLSGA